MLAFSNRNMDAIWVSWKKSLNCRDKLTDDVQPLEKAALTEKCQVTPEKKLARHSSRKEVCQNRYHELKEGDPSRSVIEKIFNAACSSNTTTNPSQQSIKIKRVLRVKNPQETVERFEKYREMVKKKASVDQLKQHPRSMVDGNELLCFYPTTMNCCTPRKPTKSGSGDLCEDYRCRACRIVETRFHVEHYKRNGIIQMCITNSTSPICWSGDSVQKGKKTEDVKKAVIICRMVAGRIMNLVDGEGCGEDEGSYDSIRGEGFSPYSEYLMVRNPDAVLPCFLVVL